MPERLRVALDGTPLAGEPGGIRRFTEELLAALQSAFPADEYVALSDQLEPKPEGLDRRWWMVGLDRRLRREGFEVFHGTDFAVPYLSRVPAVMTVHDLSPWTRPSEASERVRQRAGWLLRLRRPRYVHTPSEAVRQEVMNYFGWPGERVVAIGLAAAERFRPVRVEGQEPYFLYLGTIEERKNLEVLGEAMERLWARGCRVPLWLAGRARDGFALRKRDAVVELGWQPEERLPELLSGARAVVYPSHYEGFGLPLLEAMQCGAAVVASPVAAHREVGGEAVLYATTAEEWALALERLALDEAWRRKRGEFGRKRAEGFSWARTAKAMRELYARCRNEA
jgi:alpha-1,3-rhamnosyl/mannosyltransferase